MRAITQAAHPVAAVPIPSLMMDYPAASLRPGVAFRCPAADVKAGAEKQAAAQSRIAADQAQPECKDWRTWEKHISVPRLATLFFYYAQRHIRRRKRINLSQLITGASGLFATFYTGASLEKEMAFVLSSERTGSNTVITWMLLLYFLNHYTYIHITLFGKDRDHMVDNGVRCSLAFPMLFSTAQQVLLGLFSLFLCFRGADR